MPRKKIAYKIPYVKESTGNISAGSVPHHIGRGEMRKANWEHKYEWRENYPFDVNLKFIKMYFGGKILWENCENGARYWMNLSGLDSLLKTKSIIYGTVLGTFIFKKHGITYSLYPYIPKKG